MNNRKMTKDDLGEIADRLKRCLGEAGIDVEVHRGETFYGLTSELEQEDGEPVRLHLSISKGELPAGSLRAGVSDTRFDSRLARAQPSLGVSTGGVTNVVDGPTGSAPE